MADRPAPPALEMPIPPATAVTRDDLIYVGVEGLTKEFGVYSLDPPTEHGPAARAVVNALIAAGHLRPTEGSDTDG